MLASSTSPPFNFYLFSTCHSKDETTYLYPDDCSLKDCSFIPPIEVNRQKMTFGLNEKNQYAVTFNNKVITSLSAALKSMINIPFDQALLEKIAIVTNYLCCGTDYKVELNSVKLNHRKAKQEGDCPFELEFFATDEKCQKCKVTVPSLQCERKDVYYEFVNE